MVQDDRGRLFSWGGNTHGQCGLNTKAGQVESPSLIKMEDRVEHFDVGYLHCIALTGQNLLYSWGNNINGQLGIGSRVNQHQPVQMSKLN